MPGKTRISIDGDQFRINGQLTYPGRAWRDYRIEGLLMNVRFVQATFNDRNPKTLHMWDGPDGKWNADANTDRFIAMLPHWRAAGLLSFTVNFQGGSPQGYSKEQPWLNSAFDADGKLRADDAARMARVLDAADDLGMCPMLGLFYFGQDNRLRDETAVKRAVDESIDWLLQRGDQHVMIEIANEIDVKRYTHDIIKPPRCLELVNQVRRLAGDRLIVSTSFGGGTVPPDDYLNDLDFVLMHGNGVGDPARLAGMVDTVRGSDRYRGQPIVFNEDDHFDFDKPTNNMQAAISRYASWGYFDYRMKDEGHAEGYQSVPTDWSTSSARKRGFFSLLAEVTGGTRPEK